CRPGALSRTSRGQGDDARQGDTVLNSSTSTAVPAGSQLDLTPLSHDFLSPSVWWESHSIRPVIDIEVPKPSGPVEVSMRASSCLTSAVTMPVPKPIVVGGSARMGLPTPLSETVSLQQWPSVR